MLGLRGGVNCERMQALWTNMLQRLREWWQEDRRDAWVHGLSEHQTASVASLDVRPALDVAKSIIRTIHGDPWTCGGSTSGGDAGREVICLLRELRDGVSLLTLHTTRQHGGTSSLEEGGQIRTAESRKEVEGHGTGILFGGGGDDGHRLSDVRCSDNYWIFSDDREKLMWMVNDIIGEVMDLDMEPKAESLWWTSAHKAEEG